MSGASAGFRYDGKRALVVGGASGIGAATVDLLVDLGADVVLMDVAPVPRDDVTVLPLDLRDEGSVEAAVDACGGPIDALFSVAGVAGGPQLPLVNFIGQRHLLERVVGDGLMPRGSAIAMVSSAAGRGWEDNLDLLLDWASRPTFEQAEAWIAEHPDLAGYGGSKQAVCAYVASRAYPFGVKGIRINSLMPGPTDTPLAQANAEVWLTYSADYRTDLGLGPSTAEEQATILAFLCSAAASRLTGVNLMSDVGHATSRFTGSFPPPERGAG